MPSDRCQSGNGSEAELHDEATIYGHVRGCRVNKSHVVAGTLFAFRPLTFDTRIKTERSKEPSYGCC